MEPKIMLERKKLLNKLEEEYKRGAISYSSFLYFKELIEDQEIFVMDEDDGK